MRNLRLSILVAVAGVTASLAGSVLAAAPQGTRGQQATIKKIAFVGSYSGVLTLWLSVWLACAGVQVGSGAAGRGIAGAAPLDWDDHA